MGDVFFFFLKDNINPYWKEVFASSPSSPTTVLKTSLMILVLFWWLEDICFSRSTTAGRMSTDLFFSASLSSFFTSLYLRRHLALISRVLKDDCSNAFASTLTAFLKAFSQESNSWPQASNCTQMENLRPLRKYRIIVSWLWHIFSLFQFGGTNSLNNTSFIILCISSGKGVPLHWMRYGKLPHLAWI